MSPNIFNYIMSGCGYCRISFAEAYEEPECLDYITGCFNSLNDGTHKFSLLYNAFTEKGFGEVFKHYKHSLAEVMADSGGLQIITQGLKFTDELKRIIYLNQSNSSDTALSFDEIPLKITEEKSSRLDLASRFYDPSMLEPCARKTGQNVKEQIELFIDQKTESKHTLFINILVYI